MDQQTIDRYAEAARRWAAVDQAYNARIATVPDSRRWLAVQALALAQSRRSLLMSLNPSAGTTLVDLGCGFGMGVVEAAALGPLRAIGVDLDAEVLGVARAAAADVAGAGMLAAGSTVDFLDGNAYEVPVDASSVDLVISQFLFQHLDAPDRATREVARILRPGGVACIIDVDDGLSITYPPASAAYLALAGALRGSQEGGGGDRQVGRKVAALLDDAGLDPLNVAVVSQSGYRRVDAGDLSRQLLVERFRAARPSIVERGLMSAETFDATLSEFATEDEGPVCEVEAYLVVTARRR
ncbi:MAG TPA: methyltransferase domain-containing protein [Acidimicrobiales bacterium]|nr:methyltransferase domain-containing protein [Acidimicrobiales bacterium]